MKILILTADQELALLRQRVLESAGHEVIALATEKDALEAAEKQVASMLLSSAIVCRCRSPAKSFVYCATTSATQNSCTSPTSMANGRRSRPTATSVGADGPDALLRVLAESVANA